MVGIKQHRVASKALFIHVHAVSKSESGYLLAHSQCKFTRKFIIWHTVTNRINNRLINTATKPTISTNT